MPKDLKQMYKTIMDDHFTPQMEVSFVDKDKRQTLFYEKVSWVIEGVKKGLRYGENPGQEAALYKLVNGNLALGDAKTITPGKYLVSDIELLQSGKHPGKTNLTDADNALNILRYFTDTPCAVIVKHNNPCGAARAQSLEQAYQKAYMADRVAAFGGCIALNKTVDKATAQAIANQYAEVVVAPDFEDGVLDILGTRKNLRVIRINDIDKLQSFIGERVIDFKSLMDGGMVAQWSFVPQTLSEKDLIVASTEYKGQTYNINRKPLKQELEDMLFGWLVESGITSNSVIYVKDNATVGIGTGEQDRVGVAEIAVDKAYRKLADRYCFEQYEVSFADLKDADKRAQIENDVKKVKGGLIGSAMVSDAFFPFRDGIDVGLNQGVKAVVQPGGSLNDYQSIEACNENDATMVYTGQRSFKH
ncbi:MAG: IMP cyclohydrolase [Desulfobacula sp.]|jgi:phosphoribosylaminoimidazolecarboxamide formyltransferase / IMP cyclohydrolase|uniref:IMP cyclohydrolase n=1 Tax=Desulfobacula sp. TaxID=2593537 RepID=UPI001D437D66|nr:IMP cyclohydrolase [Desulfobacula sp.]MBT3487078.1 IMP cyclohydrolase [Desulfobacula sp.]MBT3806826.1 IMP cyclohydrolase [Desulfobacula sp.]MBT4026769.1 IMP cyclohydrolase [Desulfobacula sp.]MBT4199032.1 IMP cyclohydrolase [Desulfobacula sp.]